MKKYYNIIAILICITAWSCKKSLKDLHPSSQYFPIVIGNSWTYNVSDTNTGFMSSPPLNYDVTVSIPGIKNLEDGKEAYILKYDYPNKIDTEYVRVVNDTIKVISNLYTYRGVYRLKDIFISPFSNNQSFNSPLLNNYDRMYYFVNTTNPPNEFGSSGSAFKIIRESGVPGFDQPQYYIFKPYIGFIEFTSKYFGVDVGLSQKWKLKSYILK